jgi:hypothetical protein
MTAIRIVLMALLAMAVAGCTKEQFKKNLYHPLEETIPPPVIRQPVLPELLKSCRGHVLVPALGMTFVPTGAEPPKEGQFLREESISAPYRIIPPRARVSRDTSPTRLNVEIDAWQRIVGLYCG